MRSHAAALAILALVLGATASADEIPTIKIGPSGPDQNVPTDRAFYVTGDAKDATSAVAVVVRKGSASMFGGDGPRCSELARALNLQQPRGARRAGTPPAGESASEDPPLEPGVHDAWQEFPAATEYRRNQVLVSGTWTISGTDPNYKVLVPHDGEFFSPGHAFCLYVLITRKHQEVDDSSIEKLTDRVAQKLAACGSAPSKCRSQVLTELTAELKQLLHATELAADPKAVQQIVDNVTAALGHADAVIADRDRLVSLLARPGSVAEPSRGWIDTSDGLGRVIAMLLTQQGTLFPQQAAGGRLARITQDGAIRVNAVSLLAGDLKVRVATSFAPAARQVRVLEGVTTQDLMIAKDVSLYDVLAAGQGRVRLDAEIPLSDLASIVQRISLDRRWADDDTDRTALAAASKWLGAVADVLQASWDAAKQAADASEATRRPPRPPADGTSQAALVQHLGSWLYGLGYDPKALGEISANLKQLVRQKQAWDADLARLSFVTRTVTTVDSPQPIPFQLGFTEEAWVFSYVTPTIGYAQIYGGDDGWFSQAYLAAQIHFWPNAASDPLWSHGITRRDLQRSFAVELGFAPSVSAFGPDNRYRGVFGLPYTSVSFGWALLDRRQTVLAVEEPRFAGRFFVGLNVQLNIPDLVRGAVQKTSPTTVEKK